MAFPLDDILLGPDAFGRLHRLDMVIGHTGEEPGFGRDYAVKTAIWQRTNPGSYNFRVYDRATDPRGVMLNVPWMEASGGINPSSAFWSPGRFPFVERELAKAGPCPIAGCPGPYRNPTMHAGQISFVGRRDQLDAGKAPANFETDAKALVDWYDHHPLRGPAPLVVVMHGHWQSNRTDWGNYMQSRLAAEDDEMTWVNQVRWYKTPQLVTFRQGTTYRLTPDLNETDKYVALDDEHRTVIGEVDGLDFGAGPLWLVIPGDGGVPKVAHSQDELDRVALGAPIDRATLEGIATAARGIVQAATAIEGMATR